MEPEVRPGFWQTWILAARPKTLPAAAAAAIVGSAAAYADGRLRLGPALACLLVALLLQIGANLANDVFDYLRGADRPGRLGPLRVTQAGLLSPGQVLAGMWLTFGLAAVLGAYLFVEAGWAVPVIGLAAIAAAVAYTGGPIPYGYYGLGDLLVFIFFGPVAVCGTYFVQSGEVGPRAIWASLPMGFLITAILVVNNLRDIHTDRAAGKHTLAVRLGESGARRELGLMLILAYLVPPAMWAAGMASAWILLAWLSLPFGVRLARSVWRESGRPLNLALAAAGRLTLIYGLLLSVGMILS